MDEFDINKIVQEIADKLPKQEESFEKTVDGVLQAGMKFIDTLTKEGYSPQAIKGFLLVMLTNGGMAYIPFLVELIYKEWAEQKGGARDPNKN